MGSKTIEEALEFWETYRDFLSEFESSDPCPFSSEDHDLDLLHAELEIESLRELKKELLTKEKQTRKRFNRVPPKSSCWWKYYIEDGGMNDWTQGHASRKFRNVFRVPYGLFKEILEKAKENDWWPCIPIGDVRKARRGGGECHPGELLLLGSLAFIGGVANWEVIDSCTGISAGSHRAFFLRFIETFSGPLWEKFIRMPTQSEFDASERMYREAGMPGCFCAADGVQIRVWAGSDSFKHTETGKEGYRTLGFNVVVLSSTRIIACSQGFFGSVTDVTKALYDDIMVNMEQNVLYPDFRFELMRLDGGLHEEKRPYCLVDGGYPAWRVLIAPNKISSDEIVVVLSRWMESLRKVVECTFGAMKQRFRVLKFGFCCHTEKQAEQIMHTCCVLHNWIQEWTLRQARKGGEDEEVMAELNHVARAEVPEVIFERSLAQLPRNYQFEMQEAKEDSMQERWNRIAEHFYIQLVRDEIRWASREVQGTYDEDFDQPMPSFEALL